MARPFIHHRKALPAKGCSAPGGEMGNLLYWAVVLLIVAIVAGFFGFGGVATTAASGAQLLFYIAIVLFVIALIFGMMRRGRV